MGRDAKSTRHAGCSGGSGGGEEHAAELQAKTVAYVNVDVAVTGPDFGASGTPSLRDIVRQVIAELRQAREVQGLSLTDMEERTGMTRANLCRLENEGRNIVGARHGVVA